MKWYWRLIMGALIVLHLSSGISGLFHERVDSYITSGILYISVGLWMILHWANEEMKHKMLRDMNEYMNKVLTQKHD